MAAALLAAGLLAAAQWPRYWVWIAPEQTPMTFVQALLLFLAAVFAALLAVAAFLDGRRGEVRRWALVSLGFCALTADERFALHERLRDGYLADLGWGLPWGAPGDYVLAIVAAAGLALLPWLWAGLSGDRLARRTCATAVALAAAVVVVDSFDVARMTQDGERLQQTLEEVVEAVAGALFAGTVGIRLLSRLAYGPVAGAGKREQVPQPSQAAVR